MYPKADVEKTQAPIDEQDYKMNQCNQCYNPSRPYTSEEIVAEFFKYHAPNEITIPKYATINQAAKNFAEVVLQNCPAGADRSDAIRKIREARMVANAAIALSGVPSL